jgi:4'-phosphopantetheinyl transferase EntD
MVIDLKIPNQPFFQYFTDQFIGSDTLTAGEKAFVERAVPQRVKQFSTGRFCAKQALQALGITNVEILQGDGKEPVWPANIVGSISHSKSMAGAVVAAADKLVSIGMDIETIGGVRPDMWDMLYLPSEQAYLANYTGDALALQTTILFSGKEAFYKFQYPLTKTFLDFTDVEITFINGQFQLSVIMDFPGKALLPPSNQIHYTLADNQIITLCYLEQP